MKIFFKNPSLKITFSKSDLNS